jgi:hypothetical protein
MMKNAILEAMQTLKTEMSKDADIGSIAHSCHCNVALSVVEALGGDFDRDKAMDIGNKAASGFMKRFFGVETSE